MAVSKRYTAFVERVWDRLELRTGYRVHYLAHNQIAAYCPSCRVGTLSITFVDGDPPRLIVASQQLGPGRCSMGCAAGEIKDALR